MQRRSAFLLLAGLLVSACAVAPRAHSSGIWTGRIGLQVQGDSPRDFQASFELQGTPEQGELSVLSPLGTLLARLSWQPGQALLEQGQQHWKDTSVDALALRLTHTPLSLNLLFDWLEGRPTEREGWTVDLSAWSEGRIQAQQTSPTAPARLRILLEH